MARTAIITGSDSGIGRATAVALGARGYGVGVTWHGDRTGADEAADEVRAKGGRAEVRRLDVTETDAAADAIDELSDALGGLDVFVNNAGVGSSVPFLEIDPAHLRQVLEVNLVGSLACAQVAARRMIAQGRGGRIVNVTSVHEHVPLRRASAYCASKGALGLLTQAMALELAEHAITVNAVAPGEIATPMNDAEDVDPRSLERPMIPLGRPGHADEVAAAIAFLASPEASYATGASFVVDGGLLLMAAVANQG